MDADTYFADADGDGYGDPTVYASECEPPSGHVADGTDCDDADSSVHPGAEEACDGVDRDCDGESLPVLTWYEDGDADGYGDPDETLEDCFQPSGYVDNHADCTPMAGPGCLDVDLPSDSTGSEDGTLAVRVFHPVDSDATRYAYGAPVMVYVQGNVQPGFLNQDLAFTDDIVWLVHLGPGGDVGGRASGGTWDYWGEDAIQGLADVLQYAAGEKRGADGKTLDELLPVPVVTSNAGLFGQGFGSNIAAVMAERHGHEIGSSLKYIVEWEGPVTSQLAAFEVGSLELPCSTGKKFIHYENPRYGGYGSPQIAMDYSDLAYDETSEDTPVFWDGNGDGVYTLVFDGDTDCWTPDLDRDGTLTLDEDFSPWPIPLLDELGTFIYSRQMTAVIDELVGGVFPDRIYDVAETDAFWDLRESLDSRASALAANPDLEVMIVVGEVDHELAAPDHPHIRQSYEGWLDADISWVKLNPDRAWVEEIGADFVSGLQLPDVEANAELSEAQWNTPERYGHPEGSVFWDFYWAAAIHQMADRVEGRDAP